MFRKIFSKKTVEKKMPNTKPQAVQNHKAKSGPNNRIKHIIAVASGKGGVGKSTVSFHLAASLQASGAFVGLLDADIYGPSQSKIMSDNQQASAKDGIIQPVETAGLKYISMQAISPKAGAVVVRSPIAIRALGQFLNDVNWGELDYLIIDLPPGTGDIQLSLAQKASLSGVIVVTTPQQLACDIAEKSIDMFSRVNVPVLGIVENMSRFQCPHCQQSSAIFKADGGMALAQKHGVPLLSQIPLDGQILEQAEPGSSQTTLEAGSTVSQTFHQLAEKVKQELLANQNAMGFMPTQVKIAEGDLILLWGEEKKTRVSPSTLRGLCICALCHDEITGEQLLDTSKIDPNIKILQVKQVGRYGIGVRFSDGHKTGIYRFDRLAKLD